MKTIKLSNSDKVALVDDEDYERCAKIVWKIGSHGYPTGKFESEWVLQHRFILWMFDDDPMDVDHIDHNKINNTKVNLRKCSTAQNLANRIKTKGSSKYKGVRWHKGDNCWSAQICHNCKLIHIGNYTDETEAAKAYNEAALKFFGEFAHLNKI